MLLGYEDVQTFQLLKQICKHQQSVNQPEEQPRGPSGPPRLLTFLLLPHFQLFGELRDHQEGLPALTLLRFEDVAEDVVSNVEDVLPPDVQQVADDV